MPGLWQRVASFECEARPGEEVLGALPLPVGGLGEALEHGHRGRGAVERCRGRLVHIGKPSERLPRGEGREGVPLGVPLAQKAALAALRARRRAASLAPGDRTGGVPSASEAPVPPVQAPPGGGPW